ncbi:uncharacterized protein LOC142348846 [Convolutriloba macropyga]|uniref:uncharacterized protein LOC142348846 n=1 Tax=Convolutriloba macropyga TaxID=536237 RepID=UPI003F524C86
MFPQMKNFQALVEAKNAKYQKLQLETVEKEKALIKMQNCEKQLLQKQSELEAKMSSDNQKLSSLRVELELEKERGNWLDVSLQKESTLNQELQNEVKVANDSLEELRKNSFGELVKSCDILSLSEQRKVQDRMAKVDLSEIERLKQRREECRKICGELEALLKEKENALSCKQHGQTELNTLRNETAVQEKCINAWKIKIEKCSNRSKVLGSSSSIGTPSCNRDRISSPMHGRTPNMGNYPLYGLGCYGHQAGFQRASPMSTDVEMIENEIEAELQQHEQMMMQYFSR